MMDCDEEWLKISLKDKKNQEIVKMIRVEDVDEIEVKVDQSLCKLNKENKLNFHNGEQRTI